MWLKSAGCVTNSVDLDQTPQNAASDQGLHCLSGISDRILIVNAAMHLHYVMRFVIRVLEVCFT